MKSVAVISAFLGGAVLGAALGIIFAPAKGSETRACISDYLESHGIKLNREQLNELVAKIEDKVG
ncbi:MAG: YtxH domain-containing protein [Bacteroidetes bacterium]|uniref:YtxH domain-containing protein n=1 Tax=Candidatus Caccoplasma merdipullorum TaxID=2840718 RepID=A0A9D9H6D8_9BACT|nr:YtxH domain-containing protein [Candidatus Caccoplasma merdipullorum]